MWCLPIKTGYVAGHSIQTFSKCSCTYTKQIHIWLRNIWQSKVKYFLRIQFGIKLHSFNRLRKGWVILALWNNRSQRFSPWRTLFLLHSRCSSWIELVKEYLISSYWSRKEVKVNNIIELSDLVTKEKATITLKRR